MGFLSRNSREEPAGEKQSFALAWFDRGQWALVRAAAADPERLETTYDSWLAMAEAALRTLASSGVLPTRIDAKANELAEWSEANKRELNAGTRAEYAARRLQGQGGESM